MGFFPFDISPLELMYGRRLYDVRNLSQSFAVLEGITGAIRSLRFTASGDFMAMAEPYDFVHVFDVSSQYTRAQSIDLFGMLLLLYIGS